MGSFRLSTGCRVLTLGYACVCVCGGGALLENVSC